ncbi:unnamed protein product [Ceutorhynchus assimilis]|uniref:Uncharacterized protein n=1 Tax=Ceutorhynchus assimilis TaxID=467358 RepID=A0A9N9MHE4_9CUCU|nr:unnamed protein product [Ceutorhynchus assimilis]
MPPPDGEGVEGTLNNALNDSGGSDNTMEIPENYGNNVAPTKQPDNDQPKKMFNIFSDKYNIKFIYVMIESTESENFGRIHPLKDANDLLSNSALKAEKLRAFIPNHILESKGIIRGVDTFFSEEYISTNIKSSSRLISVKRMEKNVTDKDGQSIKVKKQMVLLTFEEPMFPFTFGPSTALAPNTLSNQDILEKEKNNLINSISGYVISLLGKIKTIEDIKNIKLDSLKTEMVELIVTSTYNS